MTTGASVKERTNIKIKEPKRYKAVMYNDDFTPMDFVVDILMTIFKKSEEEAFQIMMMVHNSGKAIVGIYSYDIAKSKVEESVAIAREEGYPFKVKVEEV